MAQIFCNDPNIIIIVKKWLSHGLLEAINGIPSYEKKHKKTIEGKLVTFSFVYGGRLFERRNFLSFN